MADRHFHHAETGLVELSGHLHTDHATCGFEPDGIENMPANETEIAIHIADRKREGETHGSAISAADKDPVPGIGALHLVAIDQINVRSQLAEQVMDFTDIVLSVSVRVKNEILASVLESGNEGGPISEIVGMMNGADKGKLSSQTVGNGSRLILASVVNDEYFEVVRDFPDLFGRLTNDVFNRVFVVIGGEECC